MKIISTFRIVGIAITLLLSCLAYLFFSSPDRVVVSIDGSVQGIPNVVRENLQGASFWEDQLSKAKTALKWEVSAPERKARRDARIAELEQRTKQRLEELYQRNPRARPTPGEQKAEELRDEADRIEQAELDLHIEKKRLRRISELQKIIEITEIKSKQK